MTDQRSRNLEHAAWCRELAQRAREIIERSKELLQLPKPDTFLGRRTHARFPEQRDERLNISKG